MYFSTYLYLLLHHSECYSCNFLYLNTFLDGRNVEGASKPAKDCFYRCWYSTTNRRSTASDFRPKQITTAEKYAFAQFVHLEIRTYICMKLAKLQILSALSSLFCNFMFYKSIWISVLFSLSEKLQCIQSPLANFLNHSKLQTSPTSHSLHNFYLIILELLSHLTL